MILVTAKKFFVGESLDPSEDQQLRTMISAFDPFGYNLPALRELVVSLTDMWRMGQPDVQQHECLF